MRRIIVYWSIFSLALTIGYFFLQVLHNINFWENVGISPAPDHIEPFSTIGMTFFTASLVVGWSFILSVLAWRLISRLFSPSRPVISLVFEIFQSWTSLSFFEIISYANFSIFSLLITRNENPFFFTRQILLEIAWINLILVCLFYTFIGVQAYRKTRKMERFINKLIYDVIQIWILTLVGGIIFLPFGLFELLINMDNYPLLLFSLLVYSYNAFLIVLISEILVRIDEKIKGGQKSIEGKTNIRIFILETSMLILPLIMIPTFIVFPLYLPMQSFSLWLLLVGFLILFSVFSSLFYTLVKMIMPKSSKEGVSGIELLKYKFEVLLATRGTMFNYPTPIDIFLGGELTETIEHRWEKVTLKMACGKCYHVFAAETFRSGTQLKPIPCTFCGSLATTPVWE